MANTKYLDEQIMTLSLMVLTFLALVALLWLEVAVINRYVSEKITIQIRLADVLVGLTIYLKTAIDFAIFIGRLMHKNPGLIGRVGIEIGTSVGNGMGTLAIVLVWAFFKETNWLLALMILLAALVLLRLAQDTLVHDEARRHRDWLDEVIDFIENTLSRVNGLLKPILSKIVPSYSLKVETKKRLLPLFIMAFTVPFILGLDDFAGYVPVFNVINVFGFSVGVFAGHLILNTALYISPERTINTVKNRFISVLGSIAFIGLAVWGFTEAYKLLFLHAGN